MTRTTSHRALFRLVLALGLAAGSVRAQAEYDPDAKPALDPFVVLIAPPPPPAPPPVQTTFQPQVQAAPQVPPLVLKIQTIIGAGDDNLAVIDYKGAEYIVGKGWEGADESNFDKRFKVVEVESDKMIVYDGHTKQRRTFRMEEETFDGSVSVDDASGGGGGDDF